VLLMQTQLRATAIFEGSIHIEHPGMSLAAQIIGKRFACTEAPECYTAVNGITACRRGRVLLRVLGSTVEAAAVGGQYRRLTARLAGRARIFPVRLTVAGPGRCPKRRYVVQTRQCVPGDDGSMKLGHFY
jgi:hypothetical protein